MAVSINEESTIPKVIHYCWFGGGEKLPLMEHCLNSWRKVMPDYKIKCWDASTLNMQIPFVRETYERKKWAFLTDYMRFYILWKEGGIYMDLDVEVFRPFDDLLNNRMFSGIDYGEYLMNCGGKDLINDEGLLLSPFLGKTSFGVAIEAGIIGSEKGHPFMKACVDYYNSVSFITPEGDCFQIECPVVMCQVAVDFGFRYKNITQVLSEGICLYKYPTFANPNVLSFSSETYACHWWTGTWRFHEKQRPVSALLFPNRPYNRCYNLRKKPGLLKIVYRIVDCVDLVLVCFNKIPIYRTLLLSMGRRWFHSDNT